MNEYKAEFDNLQSKDSYQLQQWAGERNRLVKEYAWAVPNDDVLSYLAEFDELLEVGAGGGYWAKLIEEWGGSVRATDKNPPEDPHTDVEWMRITGPRNPELENEAVLMVWPPFNERMSEYVAKSNPSDILYVGEPEGGCTGNDPFFEILDDKYALLKEIEIPSFKGVHDDFYHYGRVV